MSAEGESQLESYGFSIAMLSNSIASKKRGVLLSLARDVEFLVRQWGSEESRKQIVARVGVSVEVVVQTEGRKRSIPVEK